MSSEVDRACEVMDEAKAEIECLRTELGRAYRAVHGFYSAHRAEQPLMSLAYHTPTIGAAGRFVREGALDGSDYFIGKPVAVLHSEHYPKDAAR